MNLLRVFPKNTPDNLSNSQKHTMYPGLGPHPAFVAFSTIEH